MAFYQTVLADRIVGAVASTSPGTGWTTVTDIQTLINNARAANLPLYLKPGNYPTNKIDVVASPGSTNPLRICAVNGNATLSLNSSQPYLLNANGVNCEFEGIDFNGADINLTDNSGQFVAILRFSGSMTYNLKKCIVHSSPKTGIYATTSGKIRDSQFYNLKYAISTLDTDVIIEGNSFVSCSAGGVYIWTSTSHSITASVANNYFQYIRAPGGSGEDGNAVSVYRASGVSIRDNTMYDSALSAIRINGGSSCKICGNRIWLTKDAGIFIESPGPDVQTIGNIITDNIVDAGLSGIKSVNVGMYSDGVSRRTVIANNQVTNCTELGIHVEGGCVVTGNAIETAPIGIQVGTNQATFDLDVIGNYVLNCNMAIGYSYHTSAAGMLISSNDIKGYRVSTNPTDPNYAHSGAIVACEAYVNGTANTARTSNGSSPNTDYGNATQTVVGGLTVGMNKARV